MRLKKYLKIGSALGFSLFVIYLFTEPLYMPTAISTPSHHALFPRYIAHKSLVSSNYKGNTIGAIQEALASYVDGLEVDVRFSKDQVPFVYHGDTLEEATTGQGIPEHHTWEQLQQLSYKDDTQSKIVALEDVFKLIGSQKDIFIDIKTDKIMNGHFAKAVAALIQKYNLQQSVIVESLNPFFLISMRLAMRDILLMYDFTVDTSAHGEEVQSQFDKIPWLLKQTFFQKQIRRIVRPDILGPRWNLDANLLKDFVSNGYPVICWTVDDAEKADALFKLGVKGIQTNRPLELKTATASETQVVYDAGGSHHLEKVVNVKNMQDILKTLGKAKINKEKITIAGRRHTMGGQTLLENAIQLNMLGLDYVVYSGKDQTVTVGAGATWKKVQDVLERHGRSVKVMQSDNIFTVGGSISVNVHGWQVGAPPLASTVISLKIITAGGKVRLLNKQQEPELFAAFIGGYGQFGVIVEAELTTTSNSTVKFHAEFMKSEQYGDSYEKLVAKNNKAELAYGRLSVDKENLFQEAGLFWYETISENSIEKTKPEPIVALKRSIFRASQYFEMGKKIRWTAEKMDAKRRLSAEPISRNSAMNTDIHILWPLYGQNKDILHEYFVPKDKLPEFLKAFKKHIIDFNMNILNVTIREVKQDRMSLLPYATQDMFALVCLFSQAQDDKGELIMKQFTQKVIDEALSLKGTFYLPYRLHYTRDQLSHAYPNIKKWIELKHKWDPEMLFESDFFNYVSQMAK